MMKHKTVKSILCLLSLMAAVQLSSTAFSTWAQSTVLQNPQNAPPALSAKDKEIVTAFEQRVKDYVKLRQQVDDKVPKLSKDSTPEQIETHKQALKVAVQTARTGAKAGDLFAADAQTYIRGLLRREFRGEDRQELRKTILEAETQGVPIKVNYPYPEKKELAETPAALLLKLPQLPKEVRYRFVGRHMLLVDRENGLIIDYMLNALP